MRQSLQSKFNLLAFLVIAFFLLMLPMFSQVKADTRESLHEAKNTSMWKWTRDLQKSFKDANLEDTEVEDYWDEYREQAEQANPEGCGDTCNPDGDPDGDGVNNSDEVEQGRNPACNEEKLGHDFCQGQDKFNVTKPDDVPEKLRRVQLANFTIRLSDCGAGFPIGGVQCPETQFFANDTFSAIEIIVNITDYEGFNTAVQIRDPDGNQPEWENRAPTGGTQPTPTDSDHRGVFAPAATGAYVTTIQYSGSAQTGAGPSWHIEAYGVR